jgi:hypothetical protein
MEKWTEYQIGIKVKIIIIQGMKIFRGPGKERKKGTGDFNSVK